MKLKSKQQKGLHELGKKEYGFDIHNETDIYSYMICQKISKKKKEELERARKGFKFYRDWKEYVKKNCEGWKNEKLDNFSHYLEHRIRNVKPVSEYTLIIVPIILGEFFSVILEKVLELEGIEWSNVHWSVITISIVLLLGILGGALYPFLDFFNIIFKNSVKESLLLDYKEIIDEIIKQRDGGKESSYTEEGKNVNNLLEVEDDKIELRNISADVDIEMPNMSIHIKQK